MMTGFQNKELKRGPRKATLHWFGFLFKWWGFVLGKSQTSFNSDALGSEAAEKIRVVSVLVFLYSGMRGAWPSWKSSRLPAEEGKPQTPLFLQIHPGGKTNELV